MAYARWGTDSDVYVYLSTGGSLTCCGCSMGHRGHFGDTASMLMHLAEHVTNGDRVPKHVFEAIAEDCEANDAYIRGHKDGIELVTGRKKDA